MRSIALVHPTSLVGKELRERLETRPNLCRELKLLSLDEDEIGAVTEAAGAATFVGRADADAFEGIDLVFLCGEIARDRQVLDLLPKGLPAVLLSRGATSADAPGAVGGVNVDALVGVDRAISPHPAAVASVLLLDAMAQFTPLHAEATALTPVSTYGEAGIDELFEQTRGILAFAGNPKSRLFPAQIAFNLLPATDDAAEIERLAGQALGRPVPIGLQLLQGGFFHGLGLSLRVALEDRPSATELRKALGRARAIEAVKEPRRLGPVATASEESLLVGEVRAAETPGQYWIWAALDNLVRGGALNAIEVAETMLSAGRPS